MQLLESMPARQVVPNAFIMGVAAAACREAKGCTVTMVVSHTPMRQYTFVDTNVIKCVYNNPLPGPQVPPTPPMSPKKINPKWLLMYMKMCPSFIHSFLHSFIPSFLHSFIPSFLYSSIPSFVHSFIHSFIPFHFISIQFNSFIHSFSSIQFNSVHSLVRSFVPSFIHSFSSVQFQFNSMVHPFSSAHLFKFTSSQLTNNSYKQTVSYSHVLFLKLPPQRVPGTTW